MRRVPWHAVLVLASVVALTPEAWPQARPYIGYVYPAGGQQGSTFQIRLGGQGMDDVKAVIITGTGVNAKIVEYYWRLSGQDQSLLNEQLQLLKRANTEVLQITQKTAAPETATEKFPANTSKAELIARIEKRIDEHVPTPACASIASLLFVEVAIAPDAAPGEREIRVVTLRGVSNPLAFQVGQLPEYSRKAMHTSTLQVLGKEAQALRKRPPSEIEVRITIPCTLNGQIASGEVNRYRFAARKGQRLTIATQARQLIPYIADAVPGWFQPVLAVYSANGQELAYDDDYRFNPDPVIFFEVPKDGEYVFAIYDSIYRGREDFIYRITMGELPFVTSIFPLGGRVGDPARIKMTGWNLQEAELIQPDRSAGPGMYQIVANRKGFLSNWAPFILDTLPEYFEKEPNNDPARAQKAELPAIINGRIDRPGDWDVFQFTGKANDTVVAEVYARRLDSPLDSVLKLIDAKGKLLAFNDDHEDLESGLNTHHADSYFMAKLPVDGVYYVQISDIARHGGEEYAYRLRISAPQPDFALRVVPSSISLRSKSSANVSLYAIRKDGFSSPIKLALKDPPSGISSSPVTLEGTKEVIQFTVKTSLAITQEPFTLAIEGRAKVEDREIFHKTTPAEDRMQAFLWRHLVPAQELETIVFDPSYQPPPKRVLPVRPPPAGGFKSADGTGATSAAAVSAAGKPKFTPQQVASRLRELKRLYESGFLSDNFYWEKVSECEALP